MRTTLLPLVLVPFLACAARVPAPPRGDAAVSAAPVADRNSLELIADALQKGEIDEDTATLYRVFAVVGDEQLPPQFRGALPIRDGTTILRSARDRYRTLRPETRAALRPYLYPKGEQP
ncbi:MAG: hypothetical protein HZB55_04270 [Deltaproteobacteria bacterium]|nr:hypothetical protein [Deltaproteobacteria bacterium]